MKTAIYIEDGKTQYVLTPENEFERSFIKSLVDKELRAVVEFGSFYECRGGWTRHDQNENSLIVRTFAD